MFMLHLTPSLLNVLFAITQWTHWFEKVKNKKNKKNFVYEAKF